MSSQPPPADPSPAPYTALSNLQPSKHKAFMSTVESSQDPIYFQDAVKESKWREAMNSELRALESNNTWSITNLPKGKKPIGCKWLYKTKFNSDGIIERYKAQLVILGCRQRYGIDYQDTFAPMAKMTTVRSFLAVIAMKGWFAF